MAVDLLDGKRTAAAPLSQADLEWLMIHTWNLAKRAEQLGAGRWATLLHKAAGALLGAMPQPSLEHLRRGYASLVAAAGHALLVAEQVRRGRHGGVVHTAQPLPCACLVAAVRLSAAHPPASQSLAAC